MNQKIPSFLDSVKLAEGKLSKALDGNCVISVQYTLDENLKTIIQSIDEKKFREELQYSLDELDSRSKKKGFLCLIASLDGKAIAFDYGYEDIEEDTFYSDNTATLIEGKRVGSTLFVLEIIHSYHRGYKRTKHSTEEVDDKGRPLTLIWTKLGFEKVSSDSSGNVEMMLIHTSESIHYLLEKYISNRNMV